MLSLIKIYNNYIILSNTIINEEAKNHYLEQQIAYSKNFVEPYSASAYAPYFLAHENARFFPREIIISFTDEKEILERPAIPE